MDHDITITLTEDDARLIDERVKSGAFASPSEVVAAALGQLVDHEEQLEAETQSLRRKIKASLDDPRPVLSGDEVLEGMRRRQQARVALQGRG